MTFGVCSLAEALGRYHWDGGIALRLWMFWRDTQLCSAISYIKVDLFTYNTSHAHIRFTGLFSPDCGLFEINSMSILHHTRQSHTLLHNSLYLNDRAGTLINL